MTVTTRADLLAFCARQHTPSLVIINDAAIARIAATIGQPELTDWDFYLPPSLQAAKYPHPSIMVSTQAAYFLFVQTALQYCFWDFDANGNQIHWCYKGDPKAKGSRGCVAMTQDMWQRGDFEALMTGNHRQVREKLAAYVADMPLTESRLAILEEVAGFERFLKLIMLPLLAGDAEMNTQLASTIATLYPAAYADPFLKKAQLVLGLITTNFKPRKLTFNTELTAYSDYRIPQVLRHLGILEYSPALADKVANGTLLESGGSEEAAIRAATLLACAKLAAASDLSDMEIDSWLFEQTRDADFQANAAPFHLTRTTHY